MDFENYFYIIAIESGDKDNANKLFIADDIDVFASSTLHKAKTFTDYFEAVIELTKNITFLARSHNHIDYILNRIHTEKDKLYITIYKIGLLVPEKMISFKVSDNLNDYCKLRLNLSQTKPKYIASMSAHPVRIMKTYDNKAKLNVCSSAMNDSIIVPIKNAKYIVDLVFDTFRDEWSSISSMVVAGYITSIDLIANKSANIIESYNNKYIG